MIYEYCYRQVIVILDLVKARADYATSFKKSLVAKYLNEIEEDPDRWGCFSILSERDNRVDQRS